MTAPEKPCEACGHPQRASWREVEWTHSFNLHDEIRALKEERDTLKESAFHASERAAKAETERDQLAFDLESAETLLYESRAALRDIVYQSEWFESCAEEGSDAWKAYAKARALIAELSPRPTEKGGGSE